MKKALFRANSLFLVMCIMFACKQKAPQNTAEKISKQQVIDELQAILDSSNLTGEILIFNPTDSMYYSNTFQTCDSGSLPASTFKIVHTIIGFETGILTDTSFVFGWDGKPRRLSVWDKDMDVKEAYKKSCVPCYQELANKIGVHRMREKLSTIEYGNMEVSDSNIDVFWLQGTSKISPLQQINFLHKLHDQKLPITQRTYHAMRQVMKIESTKSYTMYGKTGWAIRDNSNTGWFVGFVETKKGTTYFATRVQPGKNFDMNTFPESRMLVTMNALRRLKVISDE